MAAPQNELTPVQKEVEETVAAIEAQLKRISARRTERAALQVRLAADEEHDLALLGGLGRAVKIIREGVVKQVEAAPIEDRRPRFNPSNVRGEYV